MSDKFFRFSRAQPHADPHFRFPRGLLPHEPVTTTAVYGAGGAGGSGGQCYAVDDKGGITVLPFAVSTATVRPGATFDDAYVRQLMQGMRR